MRSVGKKELIFIKWNFWATGLLQGWLWNILPTTQHKPPAAPSVCSQQLTLKNYKKRPQWNNASHYMSKSNNYFILSPAMSHSLQRMWSRGLVADNTPLFLWLLSYHQYIQLLWLLPDHHQTSPSTISCHTPWCSLKKRWFLNPALWWLLLWCPLVALISPLPAHPALCSFIVSLSVIKGSQGEMRWIERR